MLRVGTECDEQGIGFEQEWAVRGPAPSPRKWHAVVRNHSVLAELPRKVATGLEPHKQWCPEPESNRHAITGGRF